ncbi:MAG: DUF1223 domain-containing protein [Bacteroidetes bacterium]|nr:DUF1223 domain-containing protein [Bacteroidota bacterium]
MKLKLLLFIFLVFVLILSFESFSFKKQEQYSPVAVIELFSSQGCSSCPPADKLLSKTLAKVDKSKNKIFALSFHVDYWDYLGWKDPFSNKQFSERQSKYVRKLNLRSSYTPQIIVNGQSEFVGSNEDRLNNAIQKSITVKSDVSFKNLNAMFNDKKELKVSYELIGNFKNCEIHFALISLKETTIIRKGENAGLTLISENVVKQFFTVEADEKGEVFLKGLIMPDNEIIAYIQQNNSFKIVGATQAKISK